MATMYDQQDYESGLSIGAVKGIFAFAIGVTLIGCGASHYVSHERNIRADNLEQCVNVALPNTKHKVRRDRVLILDKMNRTIARIGLLPGVSHNQLPERLKPVAEKTRQACGAAAKAYIA